MRQLALFWTSALALAAASNAENGNRLTDLKDLGGEQALFKSAHPFVVLVTASENCPQCETAENMVLGAENMANGIARFAKVDVMDKENAKFMAAAPQIGVPQVRLYLNHGVRNAYKKGEFYREFVQYNGAQSARGLKKFLYEHVPENAPVEKVTAKNWTAWKKDVESTGKGVIVFSSKKAPSPLLAGLARVLAKKIPVAQFSAFLENGGAEPTNDETEIGAAFGGMDDVPTMLVFSKSTDKWEKMAKSELSKASLDTLLEFVKTHSSQVTEFDLIPEAAEEPKGEAKSEKSKNLNKLARFGLVKNYAEYQLVVESNKMPAVIAVRRNSEGGDMPEDWKKLRENSFGVSTVLVYCDSSEADLDAELRKAACSLPVSETESPWSIYTSEFRPFGDQESGKLTLTPRNFVQVESLQKARSLATASIPERVVSLPQAEVQVFIQAAVQSKMIPLILFGKQKDPPLALLSVANAVHGLASIAYVAEADIKQLQVAMGLPESIQLPAFIGFSLDNSGKKESESRLELSLYDRNYFGKFSFHSMLSFSLQVAGRADENGLNTWLKDMGGFIGLNIDAGGEKESSDASDIDSSMDEPTSFDDASKPLPFISSQQEWDSLCGSSQSAAMLCVVSFIDGHPLNSELESQKAFVQQVREKILATPSGKSKFRFVAVDSTCQEKFTGQFSVDLTSLPAMVVYHPRKLIVFKMLAGFVQAKVERFLTSVASGFGKSPIHLGEAPQFENIDCAALEERNMDASNGSEGVEDDDEEDWLAEIRQEEERAKKEQQEAVKRELERLKEEEKKSSESSSGDGSGKKRRRRRRRRKSSSSEKDEL